MASFQALGPRFAVEDIVKVRDAPQQRAMGVPGALPPRAGGGCECAVLSARMQLALRRGAPGRPRVPHVPADVARRTRHLRVPGATRRGGARTHACALTRTPRLLQHNVCGRSIYAQGTVDAVAFIAARAAEAAPRTLYNMVDVLAGGMA